MDFKGNSAAIRAGRSAGFTLLEIMVAMLLLTVIVTSSVSLLFTNIRSWDGLVNDSEAALTESLIHDRLTHLLSHVSPMVWKSGGERNLAFAGERDRVHFISRAPQQFRSGELFEYLLAQEYDADNQANLVLYYAPYYPGQLEFRLPEKGTRRTLITDTGGITLSYLGQQEAGRQADWWERWESGATDLPLMVRLDMASAGDGDETYSLTVPRIVDSTEITQ